MKNKVIGWNINQRSGMGNRIPQFVIDELIDQDADIIVLTELFKNNTIDYFWNEMERAGYLHAVTQNDGTNEVAILWKKDLYTLSSVDDSVVTTKENNNPNLLLVDLLDESGRLLTVVGYRIRMVDYSERVEELKIVVNKANEKGNPVLMITDCNNLRRETTETSWNLGVVDRILSAKGFERHTPGGQSIYTEKSDRGYAYEFAEDHIITRGLMVDLEDYDRSFVNRDAAAYPWGKDFQTYNERNGRIMSIEPGFPDHAIVKGYISLEDVIYIDGANEIYNELNQVLYLLERSCYFNYIPGTEEDGEAYFSKLMIDIRKDVDRVFEDKQIVRKRLYELIDEVDFIVNSFEVPGVPDRWLELNPNINYFDRVYNMIEENPELYNRIKVGNLNHLQRRFRFFPSIRDMIARQDYFNEKRQKYPTRSDERLYQDELVETLNMRFKECIATIKEELDEWNELN